MLPALERARVGGGAFIGVGPDQNFSYIAHIEPEIAYIVDLRRDNLVLHLFFKALFAEAPARVDYLCLLTGRPAPEHPPALNPFPQGFEAFQELEIRPQKIPERFESMGESEKPVQALRRQLAAPSRCVLIV